MNIQLTLALRYLYGRKLRSILTTLAVVFGVLVIFGMNIMLPSVMQAFNATILAASDQVDLTISHRTGEAFNQDILEQVRAIEGVRAAHGLLSRAINLPVDYLDNDPQKPDTVSVLSLVGIDVDSALQVRTYLMQEGRLMQANDTETCVIAATLADNLGLKVGDTLKLPTTQGVVELTIAGIRPPRAVPGNEEVLVTLAEAQKLFNAMGRINNIEANFTAGDELQRSDIQAKVAALLGEDFQFGSIGSDAEFLTTLQMSQAILNALGLLALFMGGFIIFNTFRTLVAERRRDIGMLRAVGASRQTIIGAILFEGLLQGSVGTLAGMFLGYLLAAGALKAVSPLTNQIIHVTMEAPVVTPAIISLSVVLGVGITLLAGLVPAFNAGRFTPMESLRPSLADAAYRRGLPATAIAGTSAIIFSLLALLSGNQGLVTLGAMLFLVGMVLIAPVLVRPIAITFGALVAWTLARQGTGYLAQGNLTRQPSRTAITASTTMIALAIVVVVGGLAASLENSFMSMLKTSLGSDYLFVPPAIAVWGNNVGASNEFTEDLKAVDGVGPVSTFRFASSILDVEPAIPAKGAVGQNGDGVTVSVLGINPETFPQVSALRFSAGNAGQAFSELENGRTFIANGILASTAGIKIGDMVPFITPNGMQYYRLVAIGSDILNVKLNTAYISQSNVENDFGKSEDVFIQLNLSPGADREKVESALKTLKQQYPQLTMISGQAYFEQYKQLLSVAFVTMYVLYVFLAIPSLIAMLNTLAIGVIERTREIGMLRAVGATQKQVSRMVLAEAILLAVVGIAFGLLGGIYLGYALVNAFSLIGFPLEYYFPWAGLLSAIAVGLIFGTIAAIIPARQAARLEIVQALRYE